MKFAPKARIFYNHRDNFPSENMKNLRLLADNLPILASRSVTSEEIEKKAEKDEIWMKYNFNLHSEAKNGYVQVIPACSDDFVSYKGIEKLSNEEYEVEFSGRQSVIRITEKRSGDSVMLFGRRKSC